MTIAEVVGGDVFTVSFRIGVILGLLGVATFMGKMLAALRSEAKLEQRVETHLQNTEPLIAQFQAMQAAVASSAQRHTEMTDRLDRYIETQRETNNQQRETNRELQRGITWLTEHIIGLRITEAGKSGG